VDKGLFGISEDHFDGYLSLDKKFIKNKTASYFFTAKGQAMEPSIFDKDILLVDRSLKICNGKIIIASMEGEFICKRFFKINGGVVLKSDNSTFRDVHVTSEMEMVFFGVVICVIRDVYGDFCAS